MRRGAETAPLQRGSLPNPFSEELLGIEERIVKHQMIGMASLLLIMFVFITCAPKAVSPSEPKGAGTAPLVEGTKLGGAESWEEKWEKTLKAGQKEGRVVIYASSLAPPLQDSRALFKQKYGIDVEIVSGRGGEISTKLIQERANGLFLADVFISGLNTIYGPVKKSGALDPLEPALILPEVVDTKLWYGGKLPWADKERLIFTFLYYVSPDLTINTQMVKPEEIKSLLNFLEPKWKGKLLIGDPTVTGTPFNSFSTMLVHKTVDLDFFRQLVRQDPVIMRDDRLLVDWIARGKNPLAFWARSVRVAEYQAAGAPLMDVGSLEGAYLSVDGSGTALMNKAPHPNTSKIFLNWLMTKEGQTIMQNFLGNQSAREDISVDKLDPITVRKPGQKYFVGANNIEEWVLGEQDKYLELAREVFAPLLR